MKQENKDIFEVIEKNDLSTFKKLRTNVTPFTYTATGNSVANFAAKKKMLDVLRFIVEEDPSYLELRNADGQIVFDLLEAEDFKYLFKNIKIGQLKSFLTEGTCLHKAAETGRLDLFKYLVEYQKVDPNRKDNNGEVPAFYTARKGANSSNPVQFTFTWTSLSEQDWRWMDTGKGYKHFQSVIGGSS